MNILKIPFKGKALAAALVLAGLLLAGSNAKANTISVAYGGNVGGVWSYSITFNNSAAENGDLFEIHDFSGFLSEDPLNNPNTFQPGKWALSTPGSGPSVIGPAASGNSDDPAIPNVVYTWIGGPSGIGSGAYTIKLNSLYSVPNPESFSSQDHVANGAFVGGHFVDTGVSGADILAPQTPQTNVPDGGMTLVLLGSALVGLAGFRSKLGIA